MCIRDSICAAKQNPERSVYRHNDYCHIEKCFKYCIDIGKQVSNAIIISLSLIHI